MLRSLEVARQACEEFHPGLLAALEELSLTERETANSPIVDVYRKHRGAGLVAPSEYGGGAAGPLAAVRVQRAISALAPSLGVVGAMHHFTVAMLFGLAENAERLTPAQTTLLHAIASDGLFLASGWAEGSPDQNIVLPSVVAEPVAGGYRVNGSKKPCSLSTSMDVLTASVAIKDASGEASLALLLIPATSPGISVAPFWSTPILAGAQSDEVRLTDVFVPDELVIRSTPEDRGRLDDLQTFGFTWFELLATSAYTGVASAMVERVIDAGRATAPERAMVTMKLDAAINLLEGTALAVVDGLTGDDAVAAVLVARYAIQDLLTDVANLAAELLGGISFIRAHDTAYLLGAVRALAFHPPSRRSVAAALDDYFAGKPLLLS